MDGMTLEEQDLVEDDWPEGKRSFSKELWFLGVVAVVLALLLKTFLIQAFFIPSGSMERTLHGCPNCTGDRVLVNKLVYRFRDIHRGEVVVFNGKGTSFTNSDENAPVPPAKNAFDAVRRKVAGWVGFGAPGDKDFIKRVIGIPGDVVACCTNGHVTVNGHEIDEPYVWLSEAKDTLHPPTKEQQDRARKANMPIGCYPYRTVCEGDEPQSVDNAMRFPPTTVPPGTLWLMGDHRDGSSDSRFHGPVPEKKVVGRAFAVFWPVGSRKVLRVPGTFDPTKHAHAQRRLPDSVAAPPVLALAVATPLTLVRRRLRRRTD